MATGAINASIDQAGSSINASSSTYSSSSLPPSCDVTCNCRHPASEMLIIGRLAETQARVCDTASIACEQPPVSASLTSAASSASSCVKCTTATATSRAAVVITATVAPVVTTSVPVLSSPSPVASVPRVSLTAQLVPGSDSKVQTRVSAKPVSRAPSGGRRGLCRGRDRAAVEVHYGSHETGRQGEGQVTKATEPRRLSTGGVRWLKLRSTVHMASAVQRQRKRKHTSRLSRQDSFLVKFSTRHSGVSASSLTSSASAGDVSGRKTPVDDVGTSTSNGEEGECDVIVADDDWGDLLCPPHARFFNADSAFMFYWLAAVTAALLYNVWTVIARQGFPELQSDYSVLWYTLDAVSDVIYVCDMAIQFRTGYLENGLVVYEASKLARYYRQSRAFYLDVACLTPLDLTQFWIGMNPLLRFPRFLKVSSMRSRLCITFHANFK
jgi:hypothetical protein